MKNIAEKKESDDRKKIENFLIELGFNCSSIPSAQHLIYSKNGDVVLIKNKK